MGVQADLLTQMKGIPMEAVTFVDLDLRKVKWLEANSDAAGAALMAGAGTEKCGHGGAAAGAANGGGGGGDRDRGRGERERLELGPDEGQLVSWQRASKEGTLPRYINKCMAGMFAIATCLK